MINVIFKSGSVDLDVMLKWIKLNPSQLVIGQSSNGNTQIKLSFGKLSSIDLELVYNWLTVIKRDLSLAIIKVLNLNQ